MRAFLLTALLVSTVGCAPRPRPAANAPARPAGEAGLPGTWTGKPIERSAPVEGGSEHYLYETLGGYSLTLEPNGTFSADWRGLAMEGTWSRQPKAIVLTVAKVLGKSRAEAEAENSKAGKPVNDLKLYDIVYSLERSGDDATLTLKAKSADEESVVFSRK